MALGRVSGRYHYRVEEPDLDKRPVVAVDWIRTDLPRTAIKQDLLFTLGSAMSIFTPTKNNAVARLEHLLASLPTGIDPGAIGAPSLPATAGAMEQAVDEPELTANIEQVVLDQITAKVSEKLAGHGLAALVAAVFGG